jgi:hypothetical protein
MCLRKEIYSDMDFSFVEKRAKVSDDRREAYLDQIGPDGFAAAPAVGSPATPMGSGHY